MKAVSVISVIRLIAVGNACAYQKLIGDKFSLL